LFELSSPVSSLPTVGAKQQERLERLDIRTVQDLLFHLPRRYDDTRELVTLREIRPGDTATARVRVRNASARRSPRKGMILVEAVVEDDEGAANAIWFNQAYIAKQLPAGAEIVLSGKVEASRTGLTFRNPKFERVGAQQQHVGRLAPVYPETDKLTSKFLRSLIDPLLELTDSVTDVLPPEVRQAESLLSIGEALTAVHRPESEAQAQAGRERVAFEELFLLQLAAQRARRRRLDTAGAQIAYDAEVAREFAAGLPFRLTDGQRIAAHEILTDMAGTGPMNRLLQGDVGSGKTVVCAMAARMAHAAQYQTVVMAPTEILARQHHRTLSDLLEPHGIHVRLLVGGVTERARREVIDGLTGGQDPVVVGTHALIEDDVMFARLGLIVVDEQHRFGVVQRQRLRRKSTEAPNFLAMTATPIPRSLALTMYGDVNVSEIREMPAGRLPIVTRVVSPTQRDRAYDFIREQIQAGRQAFVICPLIEESDKLGAKSAVAEHEHLATEVFPDLSVELLHGRMPGKEKEERMARFSSGEASILVATSVVEVGVDVPNATVMVVEGAERFGLAQLHQFRGRVGRAGHQSYCLLFAGSADEEGSARLEAVAATNSGFALAEVDLRLRGAGDVAGLRQHGLPEMRAADLLDLVMLQRARGAASDWLDRDPEITEYGPLRDAMHDYRAVFDLD
jgi:ATP-dependent DNA helicase RecG